jgi:hypothetical protein
LEEGSHPTQTIPCLLHQQSQQHLNTKTVTQITIESHNAGAIILSYAQSKYEQNYKMKSHPIMEKIKITKHI